MKLEQLVEPQKVLGAKLQSAKKCSKGSKMLVNCLGTYEGHSKSLSARYLTCKIHSSTLCASTQALRVSAASDAPPPPK